MQHSRVDDEMQKAWDELLGSLPPEERIKGLSPEERIKGLSPEERIKDLSPEERQRLLRLLQQE